MLFRIQGKFFVLVQLKEALHANRQFFRAVGKIQDIMYKK